MKNKTANEKLVEFMEKKQEVIKRKLNFDKYFTEEDKRELLAWPEAVAKNVWHYITNAVRNDAYYLTADTCPWCIRHDYMEIEWRACFACEYGKRHGVCWHHGSDFYKLMDLLEKCNKDFLTREEYLDIISQIEGKETK